jgi:hypothetical protein
MSDESLPNQKSRTMMTIPEHPNDVIGTARHTHALTLPSSSAATALHATKYACQVRAVGLFLGREAKGKAYCCCHHHRGHSQLSTARHPFRTVGAPIIIYRTPPASSSFSLPSSSHTITTTTTADDHFADQSLPVHYLAASSSNPPLNNPINTVAMEGKGLINLVARGLQVR